MLRLSFLHRSYRPANRFRRLATLVICALLLPLAPALSANSQLDAQRELFLKLETRAKQGKLTAKDSELASLANYPLYPYLEYNRLVAQPKGISEADFKRFEARYPDLHLVRLLRDRLMTELISRNDWQGYANYYRQQGYADTEQQCLYARALYRSGDKKGAYQLGRELWVVGESQPKVCDPLFKEMRADGAIDSELALERVLNALEQNRSGLATYAKRFIKKSSLTHIAEDALAVYRTPEKIVKLSRGLSGEPQARLQRIAVQRAYRKDYERALNLLLKLGSHFNLTADNVQLLGRVGVRTAKELRSEDRPRLKKLDPNFASAELTEWRIRLALQDKDWLEVKTLIEKLPKELKEDNRWLYWSAIAAARTGGEADFSAILRQRSFYGFVAAELEQQPFELNQQSPTFTEEVLSPLRNAPQMARIRELVKLDRYTVARSEWNSWIDQLSGHQRQAAARLMADIGWYQMGILAAAYEGFWNDMVLRFPNAYPELFAQESALRNIDPLWSLAVSRQESALFPWARSSVGARGLMQLMPATAKRTSKRARVPYRGAHELYEPHINVRLGTAYLSQMAEKFDGNRAYATAAYNAGPHRVTRWLEGREELPLDIWIELIPFDETRTYVQNVLSFRIIYAQLTGEPRTLFSDTERQALSLARR